MPQFLSLDEFKAERRIDSDDQDAFISRLLTSAETQLDDPFNGILRRPVVAREFVETFDSFDAVELAFPDNATITTVAYEANGQGGTVGAIYDLEDGRLRLRHGESWPSADRVTVTYSAGWNVADVPEPIRDAGYFIAGQMFDHRDDFDAERFRHVLAMMIAGYRRATL
ncbi:hypothetical protein [Limimaricola cinnabarinus]|uniref:hypothetical protein n=1 Tax=Limimaricola cinnabarinus TaxID=1125964 RepID=UPI00249064DD|nr:hypothetical protein [Limimaricola cinnabarinus]